MAAYSAPQFLIIGVDIKKYIYKDEKKKKKLTKKRKKEKEYHQNGRRRFKIINEFITYFVTTHLIPFQVIRVKL